MISRRPLRYFLRRSLYFRCSGPFFPCTVVYVKGLSNLIFLRTPPSQEHIQYIPNMQFFTEKDSNWGHMSFKDRWNAKTKPRLLSALRKCRDIANFNLFELHHYHILNEAN